MEQRLVKIEKPADSNLILGQSHFIKTIEDIYEALVNAVPGIKFGVAFCEASGPCLVRCAGTDSELEKCAARNALNIGAGHSFVILLGNAFPINVLKTLKDVPEVCNIYCATANDTEIVVGESGSGRAILGVIDGSKPKGIEKKEDIEKRKLFLRKIGYKL
ncbi:MAG: adenosine-specific kinase [Candidatus Omnitrophota bacterium]